MTRRLTRRDGHSTRAHPVPLTAPDRLRELIRGSRYRTNAGLARRLGVSREYVSSLTRGARSEVSAARAQQIADALAVLPEDLFAMPEPTIDKS